MPPIFCFYAIVKAKQRHFACNKASIQGEKDNKNTLELSEAEIIMFPK